MKTKHSFGVALYRKNPKNNNKYEFLLVKKRYTYHFFNFVMGHYKKYNVKYLAYLFDNMTFNEKVDILSLQFSNLWYKIWLVRPDNLHSRNTNIFDKFHHNENNYKLYLKKKSKFDNTFLKDKGRRLKKMIQTSTHSSTPWSLPKGGKKKDETDLMCAMREFEEEIGMNPKDYKIIEKIKPCINVIFDENVNYKSYFYIAELSDTTLKCEPKIYFSNLDQIYEIEQVKWVSIQEMEFLYKNRKQSNDIVDLCKHIKKKIKHYNKLSKGVLK